MWWHWNDIEPWGLQLQGKHSTWKKCYTLTINANQRSLFIFSSFYLQKIADDQIQTMFFWSWKQRVRVRPNHWPFNLILLLDKGLCVARQAFVVSDNIDRAAKFCQKKSLKHSCAAKPAWPCKGIKNGPSLTKVSKK